MMNLDSFYSQNGIALHDEIYGSILDTPLLEVKSNADISQILKLYYSQDFKNALKLCVQLLNVFTEDSGLYHLAGCCFYHLQEYKKADNFFKMACDIIYSYHVAYHFVGYVLNYNCATVCHILGEKQDEEKYLSKAQFLYHENNPNRDIPIMIDENDLHFKNPVKDMVKKQNTVNHLLIFKKSAIEKQFWKSLDFFYKRQWKRALGECTDALHQMNFVHFEYHCVASCMFFNRAMNYIKLQQFGQAMEDLSKAISFDLRNPRNVLYKSILKKVQAKL